MALRVDGETTKERPEKGEDPRSGKLCEKARLCMRVTRAHVHTFDAILRICEKAAGFRSMTGPLNMFLRFLAVLEYPEWDILFSSGTQEASLSI